MLPNSKKVWNRSAQGPADNGPRKSELKIHILLIRSTYNRRKIITSCNCEIQVIGIQY